MIRTTDHLSRPGRIPGRLWWTAGLLALVAAACAPAYRQGPQPSWTEERSALEDAERRLHQQERLLYAPRTETERDCPRACNLVANICGLADRICAIAARYPEDRGTGARCQDGRARCRHARDAISGCGCESGAAGTPP